jgi:hypothetical protein
LDNLLPEQQELLFYLQRLSRYGNLSGVET